MEEKIVKFLKGHHVLNLATLMEDGSPYSAACFYAYDSEREELVFSSSLETQHAENMLRDGRVSVAITLETRVVGKVQGAQITGIALRGDDTAKRIYIKRFPYAAAVELEIWRLRIDSLKLTDNTLGFGKKLLWKRVSE